MKINTFIDRIIGGQKTFVLIEGRLYSINGNSDNDNSEGFMRFYGSKFPINRDEDIKTLERRTFISNKELIYIYVNEVFKGDQTKSKKNKDRIKNLDAILKSDKLEIESFFLFDVYSKYKKKPLVHIDFHGINREGNFNFDILLNREKTLLSEIYDSPGLLIHNGNVFRITEDVSNKNEEIRIGEKDYGIGNLIYSLRKLAELYEKKIYAYVKDITIKNQEVRTEKQIKDLEELSEEEIEQLSNKGEIRLDRIGENEYNLYLIFPKFVFKKHNRYYLIEGNKVGFGVTTKSRDDGFNFSINAAPNVFNKPYKHPHWNHKNKEFCLPDQRNEENPILNEILNRWKWDGYEIKWGWWNRVNQNNKEFMAGVVAYVIDQGRFIIHESIGEESRWDTPRSEFEKEFLGEGEEGRLAAERIGYKEGYNFYDNDDNYDSNGKMSERQLDQRPNDENLRAAIDLREGILDRNINLYLR